MQLKDVERKKLQSYVLSFGCCDMLLVKENHPLIHVSSIPWALVSLSSPWHSHSKRTFFLCPRAFPVAESLCSRWDAQLYPWHPLFRCSTGVTEKGLALKQKLDLNQYKNMVSEFFVGSHTGFIYTPALEPVNSHRWMRDVPQWSQLLLMQKAMANLQAETRRTWISWQHDIIPASSEGCCLILKDGV